MTRTRRTCAAGRIAGVLSRLELLGRRALPALLVALLAASTATPASASLTRPDVARLSGDVHPAVDLDRLATSARSDPAPAALSEEARSAPVVGPVPGPVLAPDLAPVLVGVLIPLDELALPPALDPMHAMGKAFGGLVVGLCRRDVAAVSGSGSSETRLRGKIEPEATQPQAISIFSCLLAAGSSDTPYGEAHAETGPELLRARYDNDLSEVSTVGGSVTQTVADETAAAPGGVLLSWSLPLDESTLAAGLLVEQLQAGAGWTAVPAGELVIGHRPDDGVSTGDDSTNLRVLLASGWQRGTSYRIRLTQELTDRLHRSYGQSQDQVQDLQWSIPVAIDGQPIPAVQYDQRFPAIYESYQAAAATAGGRFPGGQSRLFQGLLTDSVTGMSYARARWYDARNAHWLSEDPMGAVDSTNLYAFVGWQPNMGVDPMGLTIKTGEREKQVIQEIIASLGRSDLAGTIGWRGGQLAIQDDALSRWQEAADANETLNLLLQSIRDPLEEVDLRFVDNPELLRKGGGRIPDPRVVDTPQGKKWLLSIELDPEIVKSLALRLRVNFTPDGPVERWHVMDLHIAVVHELGHARATKEKRLLSNMPTRGVKPTNADAVHYEDAYRAALGLVTRLDHDAPAIICPGRNWTSDLCQRKMYCTARGNKKTSGDTCIRAWNAAKASEPVKVPIVDAVNVPDSN